MGNYTAEQHMALFGGLPERGDCAPDPDAIREHGPHHLGASSETPAGGGIPSRGPSAGNSLKRFQRTGMSCDNCGAAEDQSCQPWCKGEQIS